MLEYIRKNTSILMGAEIDQLQTDLAIIKPALDANTAVDNVQQSSITNLESNQTLHTTRLDTIEGGQVTQNNRLSSLESTQSLHSSILSTMDTVNVAQSNAIGNNTTAISNEVALARVRENSSLYPHLIRVLKPTYYLSAEHAETSSLTKMFDVGGCFNNNSSLTAATLISTSTPLGNSSFISASTVLALDE